MNVVIVGLGWVGLTTGSVMAFLGHDVTGFDVNETLVGRLQKGEAPFFEPGLAEFTEAQLGAGRLRFTLDLKSALAPADVIFIAVGTPLTEDGQTVDMRFVSQAAMDIGMHLEKGRFRVIVNKSTVPAGSNGWVDSFIGQSLQERGIIGQVDYAVASNPEFLREGSAIRDTIYPDRVVIGAEDTCAVDTLTKLYRPILEQTFPPPPGFPRAEGFNKVPLLKVDPVTAELVKYAANAFLATKISFINEIANICDLVGANVADVAAGIGLDSRIGQSFLSAGIGWGGSCFPKDLTALVRESEVYGYNARLLKAASDVNQLQRMVVVKKLQDVLKTVRGKTVGVLGLSFKPNTDDLRSAPSIDIIRKLTEIGAVVRAYDPVAMEPFGKMYPEVQVSLCASVNEVAEGADALILVTEWREFLDCDWPRIRTLMRTPVIIDGRNALNKSYLEGLDFVYRGVGV
ncbi:MAG: UDP-glucose/GDP-mannose dehydrogenase family protein [Bacillota bacterium]